MEMADTYTSFEPGDLVRLKSGSPAMVVFQVWHHSSAQCSWFNRTKIMDEWIPICALELIRRDSNRNP
jgi:uncharacterized protein YodC (DUF2158 family)